MNLCKLLRVLTRIDFVDATNSLMQISPSPNHQP